VNYTNNEYRAAVEGSLMYTYMMWGAGTIMSIIEDLEELGYDMSRVCWTPGQRIKSETFLEWVDFILTARTLKEAKQIEQRTRTAILGRDVGVCDEAIDANRSRTQGPSGPAKAAKRSGNVG
jgi:hypothetical protein